jgi:hypothetical protein
MAKVRRLDSKVALARQRAELRRGARGMAHIGEDTGGAAARAAELERVHRMREEHRRAERAHQAGERAQARSEPMMAILGELLGDTYRLARTLVSVPFRMAAALRGRREAHAS